MAGAALNLHRSGSIAASTASTSPAAGALFDISGAGVNQTIQALSGVAGTTVQLGGNKPDGGLRGSTTFAGTAIDSTARAA